MALAAVGLVAVAPLARAQDSQYMQNLGTSARVEWVRGRIYIVGEGLPLESARSQGQKRLTAATAAETKAQRSLASIIGQLRISSQTETLNSALSSDKIRAEVEHTFKGGMYWTFYSEGKHPAMTALGFTDLGWNRDDEVYKVVMELPLFGAHSAAAVAIPLANSVETKPQGTTAGDAPPPDDVQYQDVEPLLDTRAIPENTPTGLIIDCTRTRVEPAMSPRIYDRDGRQAIYGLSHVDTDTAVNRGIVGYEVSLDAARRAVDRVGADPMIVPAVATVLSRRGAAVSVAVSGKDAQQIREADQRGGFLRKCSVMFVVKGRWGQRPAYPGREAR